jgi:hypothetical protein
MFCDIFLVFSEKDQKVVEIYIYPLREVHPAG